MYTVTSLFKEAVKDIATPQPSAPVTKADLQNTVIDIKNSLTSRLPVPAMSYTSAAWASVPSNCLTPPKRAPSPEMQEKEVFISMKNTSRDAPIWRLPALELTARFNTLLSAVRGTPLFPSCFLLPSVHLPIRHCSISKLCSTPGA